MEFKLNNLMGLVIVIVRLVWRKVQEKKQLAHYTVIPRRESKPKKKKKKQKLKAILQDLDLLP